MMFSSLKKYKYIFVIILILIIVAVVILYGCDKLTPRQGLLSFKVANDPNSEKLTAAILLLMPTTGKFYVGDTISVSLFVDAFNQSINTIEGKINFPQDKLEIISLSKTDSILILWTQEPSFSNEDGTVIFTGGLPSPGFTGIAGLIMTISFKVKGEGNAVISIEDAQVLANDGFGTNILTDTTPADLTLLKPEVKKATADINKDNKVDSVDVSILLANWGVPKNPKADLNGDGIVNSKDVSILLSKWTR
jgi:hypothetical protein